MSEVKAYPYVGKKIPRTDALAKVTGGSKFYGDISILGTLTGKILRSPYSHARIISIDTSKAEKLPGVRSVVTSKDMPEKLLDFWVSWYLGMEETPDYPVLSSDKVRFIGEEVAAVAADSEDIAEEALKLIDVKYEILKPILDPVEAMKPGSAKVYDESKGNIAQHLVQEYGDTEKGFKKADYVFEDEFKSSAQPHAPLERQGCTCSWDVEGNLTMWTPTQMTHLLRWMAAKILEIQEAKVRVLSPYVGGAFGGKVGIIFPHQIISAVLAKKTGRPVKIEFSRSDDFATTHTISPYIMKLKTGVTKEGKLTARQIAVIGDCSSHTTMAAGVLHFGLVTALCHLQKVPNIKYDGYLVYTNNPARAGLRRGLTNPEVTWAVESQMDMIAEKLEMDPTELRLNNLFEQGETSILGWKLDSYGLPECIKKSTVAANWSEKRKKKVPNRGIGMACVAHVTGAICWGEIESEAVHLVGQEDGSFTLYTGCSELGTGVWTIAQQVTAEILGTRLEDIRIVGGDTSNSPFGQGCWGSRGAYSLGNATKLAALDMKKQLFELAASMLEASVDDLDAKGGQIFIKKAPAKKVSIAKVADYGLWYKGKVLMSKGLWKQPLKPVDPVTGKYEPPGISTSYPFACQVGEVEVDPKTGKVKILSAVVANDVGYPLNPQIVEGQMEGGITMGFGRALTEDFRVEDGKLLTTDFSDYLMFRAPDVPEIKPIIVTTNDPYGPFGAKGLGELGLVATAGMVANAIYNATGVRIKELPMTPEKILKALKENR